MPPIPKTLFNCDEIVAACEKAKAGGDTSYATVFSITLGGRASPSAHYFDLNCRAGDKEGKLFVNFRRETFVGRILPLTPSEGSYARDPSRSPMLGVQRFPGLKEGEAPDQAAPQSSYFLAIQCLDVFLQAEAAKLLEDGTLYTKAPSGGPKPGSIKVKNTSVVRLFQDTVSTKSRTNPGMPLTNPVARMGLKFTDDGEPRQGTEYWEILAADDPRAKLGPIAP